MDDKRKAAREAVNKQEAGKPAAIRDKDNAGRDPKPDFANPAPNLAPSGMKGIEHKPQLPNQQVRKREELVSIIKTHPQPELLTGGRFLDTPGHGFAVEVGSFRSIAGIGGRSEERSGGKECDSTCMSGWSPYN